MWGDVISSTASCVHTHRLFSWSGLLSSTQKPGTVKSIIPYFGSFEITSRRAFRRVLSIQKEQPAMMQSTTEVSEEQRLPNATASSVQPPREEQSTAPAG